MTGTGYDYTGVINTSGADQNIFGPIIGGTQI
jgi:hypothetical protein